MPQPSIHFFSEGISFNIRHKVRLRTWLNNIIKAENFRLGQLNFIFCSDNYLLSINQDYLKHDTFTDIVTFDTSNTEGYIAGDIFVSIDRVSENAVTYRVSEQDELHRVMVHGLLHLLGYTDKGKKAKAIMTAKENFYLKTRLF